MLGAKAKAEVVEARLKGFLETTEPAGAGAVSFSSEERRDLRLVMGEEFGELLGEAEGDPPWRFLSVWRIPPLEWAPKISEDTVEAFMSGLGNFFFPLSADGNGEEAKREGLMIVILLIVPTLERRLRNGFDEGEEEELSIDALLRRKDFLPETEPEPTVASSWSSSSSSPSSSSLSSLLSSFTVASDGRFFVKEFLKIFRLRSSSTVGEFT
jgi:hypothetical protein